MAKLVLITLILSVLHFSLSSPISYHKPLTPEGAARLASWTPEDQPMWQLSGQYQGDIILTPDQRNGLVDTRYRWPNREIPYEITNDFTQSEKDFIVAALNQQYAGTCITPRQRRAGDVDYIYVTGQNTGCWSYVGRAGGAQQLNLQRNGCLWVGTVAHEFLHALGFYHQQSATERDDYVDILWQNIQQGTEHNFDKYGSNMITNFGERYDYASVMHYDKYAFSSNGQPTIVPKDPNAVIGQGQQLSNVDKVKLNKMYGC